LVRKNIKEKKIAVTGAGASGLCAAISCAEVFCENGIPYSITVFERLSRPCKKILATGNGRCNMSNELLETVFYGGDTALTANVLDRCPLQTVKDFFASLGLLTASEDGRIYPMSFSAVSVADALIGGCEKYGINVVCDTYISEIKKDSDGRFSVNGMPGYDNIILAAGGKASKKFGTDGSSYALAKMLGHSTTDLYPSLVRINASPEICRSIKGVRAKARISVLSGGEIVTRNYGEVLFTGNGISGICAMQCAKYVEKEKKAKLVLDLCPDIRAEELKIFIENTKVNMPDEKASHMMSGIMHIALGKALLKNCGISPDTKLSELSDIQTQLIADSIKAFVLIPDGTDGFDEAQVTAGGVKTDEIDIRTLGSKKTPGAYLCGELLDADGDCGGYNLHFAFASGIIAGRSCASAEEIK
jgi:predicted Rossmann fold flavoprotein